MELCDDRELRAIIVARIAEKGRITFADYMRACLYEPGLGYYTSPGRKVGAAGDFYTSINVHHMFGRLIAREIIRMWESMARRLWRASRHSSIICNIAGWISPP